MGLPTRLHGDAMPDDWQNERVFCPRCMVFRKVKIVQEEGKFYRQCDKCRSKWEIKGSKLTELNKKAHAQRVEKVQKSTTSKVESTRSAIICPYCFRSFSAYAVLKENQTFRCPFCRSILDEPILKGEKR